MQTSFRLHPYTLQATLLLLVCVTSVKSALDGGDFDVYLDAARKLQAGQNIYAPPFAKGLQYYYSVFFALVWTPFAHWVFATELFWLLLSYYFLYRVWQITTSALDFSAFSDRQYKIWNIAVFLLSLQFILYNVAMIQVTFFLLWAVLESDRLVRSGRYGLGGALLGTAINVKLMPILILPYWFYRGYFKATAAALLTFTALLFVPSLFIGYARNAFLLQEWWNIVNPSNAEHMFETGIGMHSLTAMLPVYLTETIGELPYRRNVLRLDPAATALVTNAARLLTLGLALLYLRSAPFQQARNPIKQYWEWSFFALSIPLLLPHQQKYAFIFAVPMAAYIVYFFISVWPSGRYRAAFIFFIAAMLFYSPLYGSDIIGSFLFRWTQHYRFLTFATLALIPISLYCNPQKLSRF